MLVSSLENLGSEPVTSGWEERNRVLGVPLRTGPVAPPGEEPQRVLGFPVGSFGPAGRSLLPSLAQPIRRHKRWALRRQGRYAPDENDGRLTSGARNRH